jgi:type IX secretion system substrate protein
MLRAADYLYTLSHYYDNYVPTRWPATFNIDMTAEIEAGNFSLENDYVDIAGSMNDWGGGHTVLFDADADNIFSAQLFIDTAFPAIEFKFRINGDWANSEFPSGGPNRKWTAMDTIGGIVNIWQGAYNILNIPMAPYAYEIGMEGTYDPGEIAMGKYTYFSPNGIAEGTSTYQWYLATEPDGSDKVAIEGATAIEYTMVEADKDFYLVFEVTPIAESGDPSVGDPQMAVSPYMVGTSSIGDNSVTNVSVYPNPVANTLYLANITEVERIEVRNILGQMVVSFENVDAENLSINTNNWNSGLFFVMVYGENNSTKTIKLIKE